MTKCMRNLLGEGHQATSIVKIAYGDAVFALDLCAEHAGLLDDQLWGWLRLARDVTDESSFGHGMTDRLRNADAVVPELPEHLREPELEVAPPISQSEMDILRIRWTITQHAYERIEERGPVYGFSLEDVLLTAEKPERAHMDREGRPGAWVHWRGPVKVVVNRSMKQIITVGGRDESTAVRQPA